MANTKVPLTSPIQNPFPAWYLREGMINAADNAIEKAASSCERWEWGCAFAVVLSIVAEFVLASIHPSYDSPWNRWGAATADALIALGIVGEVLFGRIDGRYQTELRKRSNDRLAQVEFENGFLQEKAAQAELELAKMKAPRVLSNDAMAEISAPLRDRYPSLSVTVAASPVANETSRFADQIARVVRLSRTKVVRQDQWATLRLATPKGIVVMYGSEAAGAANFAKALANGLSEHGLSAETSADLEVNGTKAEGWVLVIVGEKPYTGHRTINEAWKS